MQASCLSATWLIAVIRIRMFILIKLQLRLLRLLTASI